MGLAGREARVMDIGAYCMASLLAGGGGWEGGSRPTWCGTARRLSRWCNDGRWWCKPCAEAWLALAPEQRPKLAPPKVVAISGTYQDHPDLEFPERPSAAATTGPAELE